jgi:5-methylcytosine-specific restriction endonuclease McrA
MLKLRYTSRQPTSGILTLCPHIRPMGGRVKRKAGLVEAAARSALQTEDVNCALCRRPLGQRVERHHVVPKSEGGTQTVPVHPICHRTIHAFVPNRELATSYATMAKLRDRADVQQYLRWIANKPPDFRAPTKPRGSD